MPPAPKQPKTFDLAKLQAMTEPVTVRVEKIQGSRRMPIELPGKEDGSPPGVNWAKEEILKLEKWVVSELTGGGVYAFTVVDQVGQTLEWEAVYDPRLYPERPPPGLQGATVQAQQAQAQAQAQAAPPSTQPVVLPPAPTPMTQAMSNIQPFTATGSNWPPAALVPPPSPSVPTMTLPNWPPMNYPPPANDAYTRLLGEIDRRDQEARRREAEMAARERDNALNQRFAQLEGVIARLAETRATLPPAPPPEDPRLRLMEQQVQQLSQTLAQKEAEQQRERENYERRMETQALLQKMEQMQAEMNRKISEASSNRPDPLITVMQENARMQAENTRMQVENLREMARLSQASSEKLAQFMMSPLQVTELMRQGSQGSDVILKNVTSVFDLFGRAFEQINNLQGGNESPIPRLIEGGIQRAGDVLEKITSAGRDKEVAMAQAQAAQAQAQATIAAASIRAAHAQAQPQAPIVQQLPPEPPQVRPVGLNGTATPAARQDNGYQDPATGQTVPAPKLERETDKYFGEALESVKRLRLGVSQYDPQTGQGLSPEATISALVQGVNQINQMHLEIPAFTLFAERRFADLIDLLLPEAPQAYKDTAVQILLTRVARGREGVFVLIPGAPTVATPHVASVPAPGQDAGEDDDDEDGDLDDDGEASYPP